MGTATQYTPHTIIFCNVFIQKPCSRGGKGYCKKLGNTHAISWKKLNSNCVRSKHYYQRHPQGCLPLAIVQLRDTLANPKISTNQDHIHPIRISHTTHISTCNNKTNPARHPSPASHSPTQSHTRPNTHTSYSNTA